MKLAHLRKKTVRTITMYKPGDFHSFSVEGLVTDKDEKGLNLVPRVCFMASIGATRNGSIPRPFTFSFDLMSDEALEIALALPASPHSPLVSGMV